MIFLEKKKKKKKKTRYTSAAEGVQVFGKFVVVIEVNEREFFQRSSVYSWKCGKYKCERRENARAHFWRFQNFSFLFFFFTKRLDSLFETPLFTTYMRSHMRVVVVLDYYLPTRFSTTTTTNNNNE